VIDPRIMGIILLHCSLTPPVPRAHSPHALLAQPIPSISRLRLGRIMVQAFSIKTFDTNKICIHGAIKCVDALWFVHAACRHGPEGARPYRARAARKRVRRERRDKFGPVVGWHRAVPVHDGAGGSFGARARGAALREDAGHAC